MRKKYVKVDAARLREYCMAFGGQRRVSEAIGMSRTHIETRLRRCNGTIREDVLQRACALHEFPYDLMIGGTDKQFREVLDYMVAVKRLSDSRRKDKHKKCDSYCRDCVYSFLASSPNTHSELSCQFILYRHETRGCPAGKGCTQRVLKGDVCFA